MPLRHGLALLSISFVGCVTPPVIEEASVFPDQELSVITYVTNGKSYVGAGRFDLAEIEYRKALALSPNVPFLYSDLGYVLIGQQRYREALDYLSIARRFLPGDVAILKNTALAKYRSSDFDGALTLYQEILDRHFSHTLSAVDSAEKDSLSVSDLVDVYRNMSLLNSILGYVDEAICLSRATLALRQSETDISLHTRVLLSYDQVKEAENLLDGFVAQFRENIPPSILVDYGIVLYLTNHKDRAEQATSRALASSNISSFDRVDARLLTALVAENTKKDDVSRGVFVTLREEDPKICERSIVERRKYWPTDFIHDVEQLLEVHCNETKQSFF